jgi:hypothetical protein
MGSPGNGSPVVGTRARQRSAVSNGSRLFADSQVDQRSGWVRRMRDLLEIHIADLGGHDAISAAERSIIRRIATISIELELLERRFALSRKGAASDDFALYLTAANTLRRLLESIGLNRVARDVTPTLEDIAEEIASERDAKRRDDEQEDIAR